MRFAVEAWDPEYGSPADDALLEPGDTPVDAGVEVPVDAWTPIDPPAAPPPQSMLFVDGVRRVEARLWVVGSDDVERPAICGSYGAGAVRCDGEATVELLDVRRGLFTGAPGAEAIETRHGRFDVRAVAADDPAQLSIGLQQRMRDLEVELAHEVREAAELIVVDGPLTDRHRVPGAVGYVKTHHARYLDDELTGVVTALAPGQRTPLFLATTKWTRYSWYLRLPTEMSHGWAGVVRLEASADLAPLDAAAAADRVSAALPRFASMPHKDPRAPQNLYPIAGLERELRRRLGDAQLLWRALREAAAASA